MKTKATNTHSYTCTYIDAYSIRGISIIIILGAEGTKTKWLLWIVMDYYGI